MAPCRNEVAAVGTLPDRHARRRLRSQLPYEVCECRLDSFVGRSESWPTDNGFFVAKYANVDFRHVFVAQIHRQRPGIGVDQRSQCRVQQARCQRLREGCTNFLTRHIRPAGERAAIDAQYEPFALAAGRGERNQAETEDFGRQGAVPQLAESVGEVSGLDAARRRLRRDACRSYP